jgi:hypothetical protein
VKEEEEDKDKDKDKDKQQGQEVLICPSCYGSGYLLLNPRDMLRKYLHRRSD